MAKESDRLGGHVPYAPDFTPQAMGRKIGQDQVLPWLLTTIDSLGSKKAVEDRIVAACFAHINGPDNRRFMASHVIQGAGNYGLAESEADEIALTEIGKRLLDSDPAERDRLFATHILTSCNGLRLTNEIERFELRGETPTLEDLTLQLDRHRTAKSISTMRAWLARAGIFKARGPYIVDRTKLSEVLGERAGLLFGLEPDELEFVLAARILSRQSGRDSLIASQVADLAESRTPDVKIRRKALGNLLGRLEAKELIDRAGLTSGRGGSKHAFTLQWGGINIADDQLKACVSQTGFLLSELKPLEIIRRELGKGDANARGRAGEMLAIHLCLALGLNPLGWRRRAPHSEIDVIAERTAALTYQRWAVQVKNTGGSLSNDAVDREVGAAAGTGVTHILFLVPRAGLSEPARKEILHRIRLTDLHIYYLDRQAVIDLQSALRALKAQEVDIAQIKRTEAERRERT